MPLVYSSAIATECENRSYVPTQNTPIHFIIYTYFFFYVGYTVSVSFIEFLRKVCAYDEILIKYYVGKRVIKFEKLKIT